MWADALSTLPFPLAVTPSGPSGDSIESTFVAFEVIVVLAVEPGGDGRVKGVDVTF